MFNLVFTLLYLSVINLFGIYAFISSKKILRWRNKRLCCLFRYCKNINRNMISGGLKKRGGYISGSLYMGAMQKVRSLETSNFWHPLVCPCSFYIYAHYRLKVTFGLVSYSLSKKSSAKLMNFWIENRGVKREKRILFFLEAQRKRSMFFTQLYIERQ